MKPKNAIIVSVLMVALSVLIVAYIYLFVIPQDKGYRKSEGISEEQKQRAVQALDAMQKDHPISAEDKQKAAAALDAMQKDHPISAEDKQRAVEALNEMQKNIYYNNKPYAKND